MSKKEKIFHWTILAVFFCVSIIGVVINQDHHMRLGGFSGYVTLVVMLFFTTIIYSAIGIAVSKRWHIHTDFWRTIRNTLGGSGEKDEKKFSWLWKFFGSIIIAMVSFFPSGLFLAYSGMILGMFDYLANPIIPIAWSIIVGGIMVFELVLLGTHFIAIADQVSRRHAWRYFGVRMIPVLISGVIIYILSGKNFLFFFPLLAII